MTSWSIAGGFLQVWLGPQLLGGQETRGVSLNLLAGW